MSGLKQVIMPRTAQKYQTHSASQAMEESIEKTSSSLGRNAVYTRKVRAMYGNRAN